MDNRTLINAVNAIARLHCNNNELLRQMGAQKARIQENKLIYIDADELLEIISELLLFKEEDDETIVRNPIIDCIE